MTEAEWLSSADVVAMLKLVEDKVTDRKFRLFACACCRRIWELLVDKRSKGAVELAERFADGECSREDIGLCIEAACDASQAVASTWRDEALIKAADAAVWCASIYYPYAVDYAAVNAEAASKAGEGRGIMPESAQRHTHADLLRDIVFSPFRPPIKVPSRVLNERDIVDFARGIYEDRRFDDMPLLATKLVNAKWEDEGVYAHCNNGLPHVRGCWVVDAILGLQDRAIIWR